MLIISHYLFSPTSLLICKCYKIVVRRIDGEKLKISRCWYSKWVSLWRRNLPLTLKSFSLEVKAYPSEVLWYLTYQAFTAGISKLFPKGPVWLQFFVPIKQQHTSLTQLITWSHFLRQLIHQTVCSWVVGAKTCSHTSPLWTSLDQSLASYQLGAFPVLTLHDYFCNFGIWWGHTSSSQECRANLSATTIQLDTLEGRNACRLTVYAMSLPCIFHLPGTTMTCW